jgi:hypothetical protein
MVWASRAKARRRAPRRSCFLPGRHSPLITASRERYTLRHKLCSLAIRSGGVAGRGRSKDRQTSLPRRRLSTRSGLGTLRRYEVPTLGATQPCAWRSITIRRRSGLRGGPGSRLGERTQSQLSGHVARPSQASDDRYTGFIVDCRGRRELNRAVMSPTSEPRLSAAVGIKPNPERPPRINRAPARCGAARRGQPRPGAGIRRAAAPLISPVRHVRRRPLLPKFDRTTSDRYGLSRAHTSEIVAMARSYSGRSKMNGPNPP